MEIHFGLPIIFTKQIGFAKSIESKVKAGCVVELPPDAVLVFPLEISEKRHD